MEKAAKYLGRLKKKSIELKNLFTVPFVSLLQLILYIGEHLGIALAH